MGKCGTEHLGDNRDYWVPRIGESAFSAIEDDILCINDTDMQIKGELAIAGNFEYIGIKMFTCEELDDPNIQCMSKQEREAYWETKEGVQFHIILTHKQVDMKNSTQPL